MEVAFLLLMVVAIGPVKGRATVYNSCACTFERNEVCGSNGVTYSNPCVARCSGATVVHGGRCENKMQQLPAIEKKQHSSDERLCVCNNILWPVCGSDGRTYDNECLAECNGATVVHDGRCENKIQQLPAIEKKHHSSDERLCPCTKIFWPVCGNDGRTYDNECLARCKGVSIIHEGKCQLNAVQLPADTSPNKDCICPAIYQPVCGSDGKTYGNACAAACRGVSIAKQGVCSTDLSLDPGCVCPTIFYPVCGKDGRTYSSACQAECSKVEVWHEGPCELKQKRSLSTSSDCACNRSLLRVCGNNGVTYDNPDCAARCGRVTDYVIGACNDVCACTSESDPVCHVITGTKYINRCFASCLGADSAQLESCDAVAA